MSKQNKTLINNVASLSVVQIVNYVFPLITIPYVSRIIGPEGFGIISYITAFVSYFILIVNFGFDFTATRRIASNPSDTQLLENVFVEVFNARIVLFILTIPIYIGCIFLFPILYENFWISLVLYINVVSNLLTPQYIFQGLQKLAFFSRVNLLKGFVNTALIFLLIQDKNDLLLYIGIGVFTNFLLSFVWIVYIFKFLKIKFKLNSLRNSKNALLKDKNVFFSSVIFSLYTTTNIVILGLFDTAENVGYYTTALSLITIIQSIINIPVASALYPYIGRSFAEGREIGLAKLRKILPIVFYLNLCVVLGILLLAPFLIILIFGEKFHGSILIVEIICVLPLISGMSGLMGVQTMLNLKLDKLFLMITSFGAALSIVLNFVLDYFFGNIGTAFSYLLTEIFIMFGLFVGLKKNKINIFNWNDFKIKSIISQIVIIKSQMIKSNEK